MGLMTFLLALMLANVAGHHAERKATVVTDSNDISKVYLRAGFLGGSVWTLPHDLLREHVDVRLAPVVNPSLIESVRGLLSLGN